MKFREVRREGRTFAGLTVDGRLVLDAPLPVSLAGPLATLMSGSAHGYCGLRADGGLGCAEGGYVRVFHGPVPLVAWPARDCGLLPDDSLRCADPIADREVRRLLGLSADPGPGAEPETWAQRPTGQWGSGVTAAGRIVCRGRDACVRRRNRSCLPSPPRGRGFDAVAAGDAHGCALRDHGRLVCWGRPTVGRRGRPGDRQPPLTRPPAGPFRKLVATDALTCGLRDDGSIACWGRLQAGVPATPGPGPFRDLTAGQASLCGLPVDGEVVCWR